MGFFSTEGCRDTRIVLENITIQVRFICLDGMAARNFEEKKNNFVLLPLTPHSPETKLLGLSEFITSCLCILLH